MVASNLQLVILSIMNAKYRYVYSVFKIQNTILYFVFIFGILFESIYTALNSCKILHLIMLSFSMKTRSVKMCGEYESKHVDLFDNEQWLVVTFLL